MNRSFFLFSLPALLLFTAAAHADVAPPNSCNTAGEACDTAGPQFDQPGACTTTKCQRADPNGGTIEYDCTLCLPVDAGGGTGGSKGSAGSSSTSTSSGSSDDGGCTVALGAGKPLPGLLGLGLLGLGLLIRRTRGR